ncbi:MAG: family 20 glycosylhydrolase [Planctomycetes bacterium]|nr:family 20 glycosylhydrolase [Planctomycetota bacterium]
MRTVLIALATFLVALAIGGSACAGDRWAEYGDLAEKIEPIAPTPMGERHIGRQESGKSVQLRFPVPKEPAVGYWVRLGNVVAYTGKGSSYQLILRRDAEDGPVIYEGPVVTAGNAWGRANRDAIDLTEKLTDADRERGYVDIFAIGKTKGDGWTIYRHRKARPILAYAATLSPELRRRMETAKAMARRNISIIPAPKEVHLAEGDMKISSQTRIVFAEGAPPSLAFAAEELRAIVQERTGVALQIAKVNKPQPSDIALGVSGQTSWPVSEGLPDASEGYRLIVDEKGARVIGRGEAGCLYGAMTLGQMARPADGGAILPHGTITDWPSFPYRIIQYDIARGQTVNVDYVKRVIRWLARCKINALMFYMEDDFKFRKYPFLGREDTFTHEKARTLTAFAKKYHMQLIPQFESLGHASAVLRHDEMKDLREAGNAWVFCTSEARTWEFLDDVYGELVEAFPTTEFIHVGGDEFEMGFGKCPKCRAKIERDGVGGLYVEHMNKLNRLVKKHGKTMMFWPSHRGPTPELSYMTIQYQDKLEKDCIPTEWIYHGPASYPQIEEYQKLGFKDVYCCPAVVGAQWIYPNYPTSFRGIRGFYRAGKERRCGGACCTTWQFMYGRVLESSWYGLIFAAECSWSPASTSKAEFDRRFADIWWGLTGPNAREQIEETIFDPIPIKAATRAWRNGRVMKDLLWAPPGRVVRDFSLKQPKLGEGASAFVAAMDSAVQRVEAMEAKARRNQLTLRGTKLAFDSMRYAAEKLSALQRATALYGGASRAKDPAKLDQIAEMLTGLKQTATELAERYAFFVENCGAYKGDVDRLRKQAEQWGAFAAKMKDLSKKLQAGEIAKLPPGAKFGFLTGSCTKIGDWTPAQMSEKGTTLTFDVTKLLLKGSGDVQVEWEYTRGSHGLAIAKTQLLCNGKVVSEDAHPGWAGSGSRRNIYTLPLTDHDPNAKYEIRGEVVSRGGTDSRGMVWLVR